MNNNTLSTHRNYFSWLLVTRCVVKVATLHPHPPQALQDRASDRGMSAWPVCCSGWWFWQSDIAELQVPQKVHTNSTSTTAQERLGSHSNKVVRVEDSGRVTLRNCKFLRKYIPIQPPPLFRSVLEDAPYHSNKATIPMNSNHPADRTSVPFNIHPSSDGQCKPSSARPTITSTLRTPALPRVVHPSPTQQIEFDLSAPWDFDLPARGTTRDTIQRLAHQRRKPVRQMCGNLDVAWHGHFWQLWILWHFVPMSDLFVCQTLDVQLLLLWTLTAIILVTWEEIQGNVWTLFTNVQHIAVLFV